jgi:hypothetical protein
VLNKKKRAKFIDFQKKFLTQFCKKGLGQPAKSSLMSGFKVGGGVIVPGYLEFTDLSSRFVKHGRGNGYGAPDLCVMRVPPRRY